jgi:hypothetical protein
MTNRSNQLIPPAIIIVLLLAAFACSLTADPVATLPPATVRGGSPPSTITPSGPIGPVATIATPIPPPPQPDVLPAGVRPNVETNITFSTEIEQIDSTRQMGIIQTLIGFQSRNTLSDPSTTSGVNAARDYLIGEFEAIRDANPDVNISVEPQKFTFTYSGDEQEAYNIALIINGNDIKGEIIVIGAHYDTINVNGGSNSIQPGANDNASGVAAILEMARILAQRTHRATIVLVLFSAEEQGRYGSKAFLEDFMLARNITPTVMINLDIIGSASGPNGEWDDMSVRVFADENSQHLGRLAAYVSRLYVSPFHVILQDRVDRPGRWGDHMTFSENNIPALRFTESMEEPAKAHTSRDTFDDITPDYLRRNTQVVLATTLVLADGLAPPHISDIRLDTESWRLEWIKVSGAAGYVIALRGAGQIDYNLELRVINGEQLVWDQLQRYETIAIAVLDEQGRIGPFSTEFRIPIVSAGQ